MAFSFIDESNIGDAYDESLRKYQAVLSGIDEFERIALNKPKPNIPAGLPNVTDGTTASYIQSRSKSVIQQLPTGLVTSLDKDKDLADIANLVLTEEILPNANTTGSVIQKSWGALSKAMTYGSQPAYCFYTQHGNYFGADFKLPYIKDVILEAGKVYDKDCNVIFLRAWYQPSDIKYLIRREKQLVKQGIKSGWRLDKLTQLEAKDKTDESKSPAEREKNLEVGGIEIIFAFQKGVGATFYGYSPETNEVVYSTVNPDPRGIIPIHFIYHDMDMSNPIGRGAVELVAGLQNMLDSEMQMYQYAQALSLNPPLIKRGSFDTSTIRFKVNAIWDLGADQNASISPANISTNGITNFSNNYGLIKSQILNLNNSNDTSVSAEVGNPGFSKTDTGVKAQQERVGVSDNHLRKQFEGWFGDVCETMLNIHFALSEGKQEVDLTQEYIKRRKLEDSEFDASTAVVDYNKKLKGFKFKVDASTSKLKDDEQSMENLKGILELAQSDPELGQLIRKDQLLKRMINKSGVDDPEELVIDLDQNNNGIADSEEQYE
nr:MAG TPA: portal [Caudoviricetes sp.]